MEDLQLIFDTTFDLICQFISSSIFPILFILLFLPLMVRLLYLSLLRGIRKGGDDLAKRVSESCPEKVKDFFFEEVEEDNDCFDEVDDEVVDDTSDKFYIDPDDYLIK